MISLQMEKSLRKLKIQRQENTNTIQKQDSRERIQPRSQSMQDWNKGNQEPDSKKNLTKESFQTRHSQKVKLLISLVNLKRNATRQNNNTNAPINPLLRYGKARTFTKVMPKKPLKMIKTHWASYGHDHFAPQDPFPSSY